MLAPPNSVLREIEGTWVRLALNSTRAADTQGFASCEVSGGCPPYFFTELNCQGTTYLSTSTSVVQDASVIGTDFKYPVGQVVFRSFPSAMWDEVTCGEFGGGYDSAELKSVPLSSLGVVLDAPFHVAR